MSSEASAGAMIAAAYVRRSRKDAMDEAESIEGQRRHITRFAKRHGYSIVAWYQDLGSGAEVGGRKAFLQMLSDAQRNRFGFRYIICYDVARFGRLRSDEAAHYRYLLRKAGVEVVYSAEALAGNESDDLLLATRQWLAREYSRRIGERVLASWLARVKEASQAGVPVFANRSTPFGYDVAYTATDGTIKSIARRLADGSKEVYGPEGRLVAVLPAGTPPVGETGDLLILVPSSQERVEAVRKIFEWRVKEGLGPKPTAERLNRAASQGTGPPSPKGCRWGPMAINYILSNQTYIGNSVHNKRSAGKFFRVTGGVLSRFPPAGERPPRNPRRDWIIIEGTHAPLVDAALFWKAQNKLCDLGARKPVFPRPPSIAFLFDGRIICADCGYRYRRMGNRGRSRGIPRYQGASNMKDRSSGCRHEAVPQRVLEELFVEAFGRELASIRERGGLGRVAQEMARSRGRNELGRRERQTRIDHIEAAVARLDRCRTSANEELISNRIAELEAEKRRLLSLVERLGPCRCPRTARRLVGLLERLSENMPHYWRHARNDHKARFVDLLVDHVTVHPRQRVALVWFSGALLRATGKARLYAELDVARTAPGQAGDHPAAEPTGRKT